MGLSIEFYYKYIYNSYKLRTIIPAPLTRESQGRFSFPVIPLLPSPFHRFLEPRAAMCRLFPVFPPSFSTFSAAFSQQFQWNRSAMSMESFSKSNGIVQQNQWLCCPKPSVSSSQTLKLFPRNCHFPSPRLCVSRGIASAFCP